MANQIRLKRASGSDPGASDLALGEPAVRTDTGELFLKKDDGSVAKVSGGGASATGASNAIQTTDGSGNFTASDTFTIAGDIFQGHDIVLTRDSGNGEPTIIPGGLANITLRTCTSASGAFGSILNNSGLQLGRNTEFVKLAAPTDQSGQASYTFTFPITGGSANQLLSTNGSGTTSFSFLSNASVASDAAIAGSKISPDFGSQDIVTTGNFDLSDSSGSGNNRIKLGAGDDLEIYHGSDSNIIDSTGKNFFILHGSDSAITSLANGAVQLHHNNNLKFQTNSNGCRFVGMLAGIDDEKVALGTGNDLQIFHESSSNKSIIVETGSGSLDIRASSIQLQNAGGTENLAIFTSDGSCLLKHNNNNKLETTSSGVTVTGNLDVSSGIDVTGATTLTRTTDNATTSVITNNGLNGGHCLKLSSGGTGSGTQIFRVFKNNQSSETEVFKIDGAGLVTASNGVTITGTCTATAFSGDGSNLSNLPSSSDNTKLPLSGGELTGNLITHQIKPDGNGNRELGTSSRRWQNIYTSDIDLSNEGSSNDVDGTWGSYTIQEGAESLFLINKRNGKKYKFNLTEVS